MAVDLVEALLWRFPKKWEQVALLLEPCSSVKTFYYVIFVVVSESG